MSARDELADLLMADELIFGTSGMDGRDYALAEADAVLAAGYRKPWTITKAAERSLLLPGTIGMDSLGNAWKRGTGSWVSTGGDTGPLYDEDDITLTVLHEGSQS